MIRATVNSVIQNKNSVMFITAVVFMAGVLAYFNDCAIPCAALLTIIGAVVLFKNYFDWKLVLFWLGMFYFGFFNAYFKIQTTDDILPLAPAKAIIEGQIVSTPKTPRFFFRVDKIDDKRVNGKTIVTIPDAGEDFLNYQVGDFYKIKGKLRVPFAATNPSQFDYGKYLRNFDTFTTFYADKDGITKDTTKKLTPKWRFMHKLSTLRNKIVKTHATYLKSPNLEILGGIVFGDDAVAPPDYIKASFVNSGLLHILAASGMNVAFIYGFWFWILRRFRAPYNFTIISGIGVVTLYTLMTGLGPSIIRAALMLIIILIGKLIDRSTHSVSLLALVALLMLIYNPSFINDVGFQLSFIVTFGLLTMGAYIFERLEKMEIKLPPKKTDTEDKTPKCLHIPGWLSGAILIPLIAQIWIAPIQMFYFNTISTYSIFANILSVPFLSVVSFGGFVSSILAAFMPHTELLCRGLDFLMNYMLSTIVWISNFFAQLPHSLHTTTHPALFQLLLYYVILAIATLILRNGRDKKLIIAMVSVIVILALSTAHLPNRKLEIIAFDVQNADAFLIKTPKDKYFMIDTGKSGYNGAKSQAEFVILKYMKDHGIKNLEGLIITHFDNDHSGGAADIMKALRVKKVYINSFDDKAKTSKNIYKTINELKIPTDIAMNNAEIYTEGNLHIKTFVNTTKVDPKSDNDNSIMTLLSYCEFDMLFMGDAGIEGFEKVKTNLPHNVEILKVGHHGGRRVVDAKMLEHLGNEVSLISTGVNVYGHPNKGTLDILRKTDIYRTDRHNSIKITADTKGYTTHTYDKEKKKYLKAKIHGL